jgi:hypothetical protein
MKSTTWTFLILTFPLTGCGLWGQPDQPPPILDEDPVLFCDVEEKRRFSQEEWDWRAANAPWNLRRDVKTNTTFDRECALDSTDDQTEAVVE